MPQEHQVKTGETLDSIALVYGLLPDTVWLHESNGALRDKRKDGNVLVAGDTVNIPDPQVAPTGGGAGARHRFRRLGVPTKLSLHLVEDGEPVANASYRLEIDGKTLAGITDGEGLLEENVPHDATTAVLKLGEPPDQREFDVQIGALDPVDEATGVQGRLQSLGFDCGGIDGDIGERTRAALVDFQRYINHPDPQGVLDDDTRAALDALHDKRED